MNTNNQIIVQNQIFTGINYAVRANEFLATLEKENVLSTQLLMNKDRSYLMVTYLVNYLVTKPFNDKEY